VYAATKSYVLSLTRALQFELRPRGIHVMAICPGPVDTEFLDVANKNQFMEKNAAPKTQLNHALMASASSVVAKALKDADKRKIISVYGWAIQLFTTFIPFVPKQIAMRCIAKQI
jgi:short-subunit dehydrogenase